MRVTPWNILFPQTSPHGGVSAAQNNPANTEPTLAPAVKIWEFSPSVPGFHWPAGVQDLPHPILSLPAHTLGSLPKAPLSKYSQCLTSGPQTKGQWLVVISELSRALRWHREPLRQRSDCSQPCRLT